MSVQQIITSDDSGRVLVDFARQKAEEMVKKGLKRSQIRNIFGEVRQIQSLWSVDPDKARRRLNLLKPKLEYQVGRKKEVETLQKVLSEAIDEVDKGDPQTERDQRFLRFVELFEAMLAYHRALGGDN